MYSANSDSLPRPGSPRYRGPIVSAPPPPSSDGQTQQRKHGEQTSEQQGPPTKRRRAALACSSCRTRKSRCDGVRPRCSTCQDLGFECRYQPSPAYPNVIIGKEYLSSIEDRLKVVENRLFSLETLTPPSSSTGPESSGILRPTASSDQSTRADGAVETACVAEDSENSGDPDSIDGMGTVTFEPEEDCAFFGPSSNIALIREISRAVARIGHTGRPWVPSPVAERSTAYESTPLQNAAAPSPSSLRYSFSDPYKPSASVLHDNQKINVYTLPPEHLAQELIRRYFSNTGQLFPYIHEQTFTEKYDQMKQNSSRGVRRTWLGLLNMVFAMATSVSLNPDDQVSSAVKRTTESDVYYRRASGLCNDQIALGRGMNLDAVHFLLLMGQYLQGTQKSVQAWVTHGLVMKVALQLGLHSSEASKGYSPLEQEIRKRTWYACIFLDRTLSMTFGRPSTIPESHVKLDLPVPYSSIIPESGTNKLDEMSVEFFNSTITLYRIMSSTIDLLYEQNLGCGTSTSAVDIVARVFNLESDIVEWQRTSCHPALITASDLPDAIMRAENATFATQNTDYATIPPAWWPIYELRLRTVITLRHNNVRILVHRPVLARLLSRVENTEPNMEDLSIIQQVGSSSVQKCTRSAKEIISIVSALVHSKGPARGLLGAWWFTLYYTFNAALVIVGGILISIQDRKDLTHTITTYDQDAGHYLHEAITALRNLDSDNRMVARCLEYLVQLVQVLESLLSNRGHASGIESQLQGLYNRIQLPATCDEDYSNAISTGTPLSSRPNLTMSKQSPLGMDLGEFLVDGDFTFLNDHMFAFGQDGSNSL